MTIDGVFLIINSGTSTTGSKFQLRIESNLFASGGTYSTMAPSNFNFIPLNRNCLEIRFIADGSAIIEPTIQSLMSVHRLKLKFIQDLSFSDFEFIISSPYNPTPTSLDGLSFDLKLIYFLH